MKKELLLLLLFLLLLVVDFFSLLLPLLLLLLLVVDCSSSLLPILLLLTGTVTSEAKPATALVKPVTTPSTVLLTPLIPTILLTLLTPLFPAVSDNFLFLVDPIQNKKLVLPRSNDVSSFNTVLFLAFWNTKSNVSSFDEDGLGGRMSDEEEEESLKFLLLLLLPEPVLLSPGAIFAVCGFRMFMVL